MSVDLSWIAATPVELLLPDGTPYHGPATYLLDRSKEGDDLLFFEAAPYLLLGLAADAELLLLESEETPIDRDPRSREPLRVALGWP